MAALVRTAATLPLLATLFVLAAVRADEPARPTARPPAAARTLDPAKLPANAVIIVSDNPRDALQNVDAVVLTPEEYKKLLDAAEQAKRLAAADKPEPPTVCRLSGRIETRGTQEVAALRAEFQFRTSAARSTVLLGLQKGRPVAATIDDGKLAVLVPMKDEDGFTALVDGAGEHKLTVDLDVPIASRGSKGTERGVELGLPGAAITTIERLSLPAGVTKCRLAGRPMAARQLAGGTEKAPAVLLGPTGKLELSWDTPAAVKAEPETAVDVRYDVRVDDHAFVIHARLTLKVQGGPVGRWEILAPPTAELAVEGPGGPDATVRIDKPRDKFKPWVVRRDPSMDDLILDVNLRTAAVAGRTSAVPAFRVLGATQQRGTIVVGAPQQLRLTFKPAAELTRRENADDGVRDAVFTFHGLPEAGPLLEIDVRSLRGDVETQVSHQLTLGERGWRWQGKFDVRPMRTEVTGLDLEVPAEIGELRSTSAEQVEGVTPLRERPGGAKVVRVQFAEARRKPFAFALEGVYRMNAAAGSASLPLPRPLGTLDRGGQLAATVPAGLELRGTYREWEGDRPGDWERAFDGAVRGGPGMAASPERAPARVDLTWRAPRADVLITATADVELGERQATVRHRWHVPAGPASPRQFVARGPAAVAGRLRVLDGGSLTPSAAGEWSVLLSAPAGREAILTLAYSFALLPTTDSPVPVPLVWLEPCPRCETDVRVWSGAVPAGVLIPALAGGPWTEVPLPAVPDRPTLPSLALHATGTKLPLDLRLTEAGAGPGTGLVVERIWVQVVIDADGQQAYRTSCLIRPRETHYLDVELPGPPAGVQFAAVLDGKRLPWAATEGASGRFVRLRLDAADAAHGPQRLDLIQLLPPPRPASRWQVGLTPPRLRGPVFVGPVRWQVAAASDDLFVGVDDSTEFQQRWIWQRGLFTPGPAWTTGDLRRWFSPTGDRGGADTVAGLETGMVLWQPALEPLQFLTVPRPLALLLGSLAVVAVGLAAVRARAGWRAAGAVALAAGLVWLAIARPQALAVVLYAAQPGAAVLAVVFVGRSAARRRYRRRVLFLPGVARSSGDGRRGYTSQGPPAGSSLVRNGSGPGRVRREPSTIDAPISQSAHPGR